jgi:hypothetical protein
MILSHRHRFVYIKTHKTASSSIEAALSSVCGPQDVITPTRPALLAARQGLPPQNYRLSHPLVPKRPLLRRWLGRPERLSHPSVGFYEHMPAWRVRRYVGEEIWATYLKFSFDRNPWDRQVSWYFFKCKEKGKNKSFEAFLARKRRAYVENYDLYSESGEIILDFVGRYESLNEDFECILERLGLAGRVDLPRLNVSQRERDYRHFYNDSTRALVGDWYRREIEHFGYAF